MIFYHSKVVATWIKVYHLVVLDETPQQNLEKSMRISWMMHLLKTSIPIARIFLAMLKCLQRQ
jgi:hypothetical protein